MSGLIQVTQNHRITDLLEKLDVLAKWKNRQSKTMYLVCCYKKEQSTFGHSEVAQGTRASFKL